MYIESVVNKDGTPIPHINGLLHYPLSQYLIHLRQAPMARGGRRESATIINNFKHLKMWFDCCVDLGVGFEEATYEVHMGAFKKALMDNGVSPQSINAYYRSWRAFYEWCEKEEIVCMIEFPPKNEIQYGHHSNSSIVGSSRSSSRTKKVDPGLESEVHILDYKDVVLSNDEYAKLSAALTEIDPVFNYIGFMMVTTGLRVSGVVQIPLGSDARNPGWLRYPELEARGLPFQKLTYLPKGRKRLLRCLVLTEALKRLHCEYITGYRKQRLKVFAKRFPDESAPLWLNTHGKRVEFHDIWNAFREASKHVGRRVTPHHLRHTYATFVVYHYFKAHGLKPNLAYAHDIHEALRIQLGHQDIEVTKRYIRTVIRTEADAWLPVLTPHVNQVVQENMPAHVLASVSKFFESGEASDDYLASQIDDQ